MGLSSEPPTMTEKVNQYQNNMIDLQRVATRRDEILNDSQLCTLRKIIYKIYTVDKEIPTLNKIYVAAKQCLDYGGSKTLLRKLLSGKLFFKFKICKNNGPLPQEQHKTALNRISFLRQLDDNESLGPNKRHIVYFDEVSFILKKDPANNFGEMWYLLYAGSDEGIIDNSKLIIKCKLTKKGTPPKNMPKNKFLNWLKDILIPNLPQNSIVIFDDAQQHNKLKEIIPDVFTPTQQIVDWLQNHNVETDKNMIRAELLSLVKINKPQKNFVADDLIEAAGHTALRLPVYTDLNPMENILLIVKEKVEEKCFKESEGSHFIEMVNEVLASITKEDWMKELQKVKNLEKEYYENEHLLDKETDELDISFEESEGDVLSSDSDDYLTDFSYDSSDISEESNYSAEDYYSSDEVDTDDNSYSV